MSRDCERLRELAPELALGIADGAERAQALDHLSACGECRAHLERLSSLADELTLLAPPAEPPAGFEARVAAAIDPARATAGRRRLVAVAAAVAAAAIGAAAVWFALSGDRELADSYRETLAVADGEYFDAAALELPGGEKVGYVYGYQGRTSWVIALVHGGLEEGSYELELVTDAGEKLPLRRLEVAGDRGSAGAAMPIDYDELAEVRLLDRAGREVAGSRLRE